MTQPYEISDTSELLSPSLVLFKDRIEANLVRMVEIAGSVSRLRPHCKTHKMAAMIEWQVSLGIVKHKCATVAEAEMLAQCGVEDIFLAYNPVGPNIQRVCRLLDAYPGIRLKVTADHPSPARDLEQCVSQTPHQVEVLLDINPGMNRTGIDIGEQAETLYRQIHESSSLVAGGFHVYDGHHRQADRHERCAAVQQIFQRVVEFRKRLESQGLPIPRIVAGGTGSFPCFAEMEEPGLELSPGTVVFYDAGYRDNFADLSFEPAALILTRVISRPAGDLLTLDLGHKACAADPPAGKRLVFPELSDAIELQQSEEHLVLKTAKANQFAPGDHLLAIPWHICPTSALHRFAYLINDGRRVDTWEVTSRDRQLSI